MQFKKYLIPVVMLGFQFCSLIHAERRPYSGVQFPSEVANTSGGMRIYPMLLRWKGFSRTQGWQLSFEDPDGGKSPGQSQGSFNLTYAKPKLKGFDSNSLTHYGMEYENRSYDTGISYTSAAIGVQRIKPNLGIRDFFSKIGQSADTHFKPYVSFRLGYRVLQNVPLLGNSGVLQVSYTLSDDYRFPSAGPHGFSKVPLKGIRFDLGFRY
ncbi:hypothetical protein HOF92_00165 [bacterium]|jgi:hypothetical protein|nr:hypothetical protein [bacterium]